MKLFKAITVVYSMALVGTVLTPAASAADWDQKTVLTFSGPVEIPGVHLKGWRVLPAGTYVFKLEDSQQDRHIVQIFNKDETVILRDHSGDPELSPESHRQDRHHIQRKTRGRAGSTARVVLSREKLRRGICLSEVGSDRNRPIQQRSRCLHARRNSVGSLRADQAGG